MSPSTLIDKVWDAHIVDPGAAADLLYIDMHLIHEVTSPQAFAGLRQAGRRVRRPDLTVGTADHDVPTPPAVPLDAVAERQRRPLFVAFCWYTNLVYRLGIPRRERPPCPPARSSTRCGMPTSSTPAPPPTSSTSTCTSSTR